MTMNNDLTVPEFTSIASTVMAPQQQQQQQHHVSSTPRNFVASTILPLSFRPRNRSRSVRRVLRELGHNDARANNEMFARHMSDLETISRQKFIASYNFDPVLMQPTDGPNNRYEWERQTPTTCKEQQVKTLLSLPKNSMSQMKQQHLSELPASVDTETADTASLELQSRLQPAETTVTSTNDEATTENNQSSKKAADTTSDSSSSKGCLDDKSISSTTTTATKDAANTKNKEELEGKEEGKEREKLPSDLPKVVAATVVTSTLTTARINSGTGTGPRQTRITDFTRHRKRVHSSSAVKQDQDGSMQSSKRQRLH